MNSQNKYTHFVYHMKDRFGPIFSAKSKIKENLKKRMPGRQILYNSFIRLLPQIMNQNNKKLTCNSDIFKYFNFKL